MTGPSRSLNVVMLSGELDEIPFKGFYENGKEFTKIFSNSSN